MKVATGGSDLVGFFFRDGVWAGVFWSWDFEGGKK